MVIDNEQYDDVTLITIDSANRPGTLIEVRAPRLSVRGSAAPAGGWRSSGAAAQGACALRLAPGLWRGVTWRGPARRNADVRRWRTFDRRLQVVQCLTELNLSIRKARISSDGGWFVDGERPCSQRMRCAGSVECSSSVGGTRGREASKPCVRLR